MRDPVDLVTTGARRLVRRGVENVRQHPKRWAFIGIGALAATCGLGVGQGLRENAASPNAGTTAEVPAPLVTSRFQATARYTSCGLRLTPHEGGGWTVTAILSGKDPGPQNLSIEAHYAHQDPVNQTVEGLQASIPDGQLFEVTGSITPVDGLNEYQKRVTCLPGHP